MRTNSAFLNRRVGLTYAGTIEECCWSHGISYRDVRGLNHICGVSVVFKEEIYMHGLILEPVIWLVEP